jgi:hypothetical protein
VRCELLLGPHVPLLLGDPPERDLTRQDSGAEESDSLHCESLCLFIEFSVQLMCVCVLIKKMGTVFMCTSHMGNRRPAAVLGR